MLDSEEKRGGYRYGIWRNLLHVAEPKWGIFLLRHNTMGDGEGSNGGGGNPRSIFNAGSHNRRNAFSAPDIQHIVISNDRKCSQEIVSPSPCRRFRTLSPYPNLHLIPALRRVIRTSENIKAKFTLDTICVSALEVQLLFMRLCKYIHIQIIRGVLLTRLIFLADFYIKKLIFCDY